jgi:hypothetical protein
MKNLRIKKFKKGLFTQYDLFRDFTNEELSIYKTFSVREDQRSRGFYLASFTSKKRAEEFVKEHGEKEVLIYTENGFKINDYVRKGLTFYFKDENAAEELAREMRSYVYDVFGANGKSIGYAVPK